MGTTPKVDTGFINATQFGGLNNQARETSLPGNVLREAENVDIDGQGKVRSRQGYQAPVVECLAGGHSLWGDKDLPFGLYVDGGELRLFWPGGQPELLQDGLSPGMPMSYQLVNDKVFWSNGGQHGVVMVHTGECVAWGCEQPTGQPTMQGVPGQGRFQAGSVQVAVTFVDAQGRESGAATAAAVDIDAGGLRLTDIPQPTSLAVTGVRIYATTENGAALALATQLPVGITTYLLLAPPSGRLLATQHMETLPPGHLLAFGNGRMYSAVENVLFWSESLRYGLCNVAHAHLRFPHRIDLMAFVGAGTDGAGLFVAAGERTYWLGGADPSGWRRVLANSYGAVPGTCIVSPGDAWGLETKAEVPVWLAGNGQFVAGLPGGSVINVSGDGYITNVAETGAAMYRHVDGVPQIVASLRSPTALRSAVGDDVVVRVYRHDGEEPDGEAWGEAPPRETW